MFWFCVCLVLLIVVVYILLWSDIVVHWADPITSNVLYSSNKEKYTKDFREVATKDKMLIVGAGFTGLSQCAAFMRHNIAFDVVEVNKEVGGNWYNGVYETVHIISSKKTTEYKDYVMPEHYPDFPSAKQMWQYLNNYCDHFNIRQHIKFEHEAVNLEAIDEGRQWRVTIRDLKNNKERVEIYKGVLIANGHHWDKRMPTYKGQENYSGEFIHSKDYKKPLQLKDKRVLVIGGGNSACDISVESARFAQEAHVSMRRGYWFLPRVIFGVPLVEFVRPWMPMLIQRMFLKIFVKLVFGNYERYGLQQPDHNIFEHHPTINSELVNYVRLGAISPHPDISCFTGDKRVKFVDGKEIEVDMIVACTGYHVSLPLLKNYVKVENNCPDLLTGGFLVNYYNIYALAIGQPRYGAGPLLTASSETTARIILAQQQLTRPVSNLLQAINVKKLSTCPHSADILVDPHVVYKQLRILQFMIPFFPYIEKLLKMMGKV